MKEVIFGISGFLGRSANGLSLPQGSFARWAVLEEEL